MHPLDHSALRVGLKLALCALLLKVTAQIVAGYHAYLPPDFQAEFLHGRAAYFWRGYHWAFYLHIASGPCTLLLGTLLLSARFRRRLPRWHRRLGRVQVALVVLALVPSGLWMARYAQAGGLAGWGFAGMGMATGCAALAGWYAAVRRRFDAHQRWMTRCYLLLCSAIVLRLLGGFFATTGLHAEWTDPSAAWLSWLAPLAAYELYAARSAAGRRAASQLGSRAAARATSGAS